MTTGQTLTDAVRRITAQLAARGNPDLTGLPETLCRALKVQEEAGELAQAVIGVLGQNPRKGITHTWHDVVAEAIDTALSALVLAETVDPGNLDLTLTAHLARIQQRAAASGAPAITPAPVSTPDGDEREQRRTWTLRWLLDTHIEHGLALPKRLNLGLSGLDLMLDDDRPDDVRRWAALLGAPVTGPREHRSSGYQWTSVEARTAYGDDPTGLGWRYVQVDTVCDYRPETTDTASLAVAA